MGDVVPFKREAEPPAERPDTAPEPKVFEGEPVEAELVDVDGDGNPDVYTQDGSRRDSLDGPDNAPVMVDTATSGLPAIRADAQRRDVLPGWLKSRADATSAVKAVAADAWHRSRYHGLRLPWYGVRLAGRCPRGAYRVLRGLGRYAFGLEGAPLRHAAVAKLDTEGYLKLTREHSAQIRRRLWLLIKGALATVAGVVLLCTVAPGWLFWLVAVFGVLVFGVAGRVPDKPVITRAVVRTEAPPLTAASVEAALAAIGISGKAGRLEFPAPITRDGPGWRADIDLPLGATPGDVMEKRPELASGLRRKLGCVWPTGDPTQHAGRLIIWVGDQDMASMKPIPWPLAKHGQADLFKPLPFGTDQRGRPVAVTLMFASMVVGSIPRMGKTFSVRLLLLGAALDPIAELHIFDLKAPGISPHWSR